MRVLITGISGFVGSHLAAYLRDSGATVFGIDRVAPANPGENNQVPADKVFIGSLLDESFLKAALNETKPTHVFHLAGVLSGAPGGPAIQYTVNVLGTVALLETLRSVKISPWVLSASSSAVYGAPSEQPIDEQRLLQPLTHYAASKAAQEMVAIQAQLAKDFPVVRTRTFNMIGRGQALSLLTSNLAQQVVSAELGGSRVLRVGNVNARRDFTDIRDVVRAYALLSKQDHAGDVFNVCSGVSHSVQECIDVLMKMSGVPLEVEIESSRIRTHEIDEQVGDPGKLHAATGWRPEISFADSLGQLLEYSRQELRNGEN